MSDQPAQEDVGPADISGVQAVASYISGADQISRPQTPPRAVQALNDADRELEELMESFFVHLEGAKNVLLAYREAFDYETINKLSLPKKLQLRLFLTERGVSLLTSEEPMCLQYCKVSCFPHRLC